MIYRRAINTWKYIKTLLPHTAASTGRSTRRSIGILHICMALNHANKYFISTVSYVVEETLYVR